MWFIGGIIGFILGAVTGSGAAMFFFTLLGGFVAHLISSSQKKVVPAKQVATVEQQNPPKPLDSMGELRLRIARLESRLQDMEGEIAELKAGKVTVAVGVPDAPSEPATTAKILASDHVEHEVMLASVDKMQVALDVAVPISEPVVAAREIDDQAEYGVSSPEHPSQIIETQLTPALQAQAERAIDVANVDTQASGQTQIKRPISPPSPPPSPPKPLKDRLPAPIAKLIFGGNTLVKVGVLILFLGLAFLLRYTAERVTVPVELRYAGVAMVGVVLLVLGWILRNKRRDYALILQGMAIGVFYLTTLSAMKLHALIPPEAGFGFMFMVSVLSAVLAVLQNAPMLAIVAALEGFATPVLTATGENRPIGLFTYLAVLDVGICLVAWFNAWRVLNLIGFIGTFTLALAWSEKNYTDSQYGIVQPYLIFFFILFALVGLFFARRTLKDAQEQEGPLASLKRVGRVDSALVFGNPVTAFGMQYMLVKHTEFGAAFSALAVGFFYLLLARLVFSRAKQGLALLAEAYVIVAGIFATLAIPLGLEGIWTGAAWAIEGAGMYWLGMRQQRPYARGAAYLVMVGAAYKLLHGIYINPESTTPLLQGSWLGPVLLALSCFTVWHLHRRARQDQVADWELVPSSFLPWLGMAATSLLPWMFLPVQFAAAALALLAVVVVAIGHRIEAGSFTRISAALQATSLGSFLLSLHAASAESSHAALADGWRGGLAAIIIAGCILYSAGRSMLDAKRAAQSQSLPPSWSLWNSLAVVSGTTLLHLAMLFAIDLTQASAIWPLTSCLVLWVALRMSHGALAGFSGGLQIVSAALCMLEPGKYQGTAFAHLGFLAPLAMALSAWLIADMIRAEAARMRQVLLSLGNKNAGQADSDKLPAVWLNPWCNSKWALGLPVIWGLSWWLVAWFPEVLDTLDRIGLREYSSAAAVTIPLLSSMLMAFLAGWRSWPQMGATTIVSLPLLAFAALAGLFGSSAPYLPSSYLGWLVWPLALVWHLQLLRRQEGWMPGWPRLLTMTHISGFWFFLLLAAREGQARLAPLADTWSSWPLLGWVLVPAVVFWGIGAKRLTAYWPLNKYRSAYIQQACAPVALYLLVWCWLTNAASDGNASPLPYLPLLNPLELGQWLVLAALLHWWRALTFESGKPERNKIAAAVAAATALALLTGIVLRSCHHFASVPWDADALFASRLTQAAVSITWAICGVGVMLFGNRRSSRNVWIAGATLLGVVVLKLFLVELADQGGLYRIISFIAVGILLLVVGYFAPVPVKPKANALADASDNQRTKELGAEKDKSGDQS